MRRLIVLPILLVTLVPATHGQGNRFLESYFRSRALAQQKELEEQRIKLEQERIQANQRIAEETLILEQQRLKGQQAALAQQPSEGDRRDKFDSELQAAVPVLRARYADLEIFAPEMMRLASLFVPSGSIQTTGEIYLEGLYALAKYARFSALAGRAQPDGKPFGNSDVVTLVKAGLSEDTILARIRVGSSNFRLESYELIDLKAAGVTERLIQAMIEVSSKSLQ